ncbi:MAG: hypothetical protein ABSB32_02020 [Thermodesulfobacteriota bacterium]
MIQNDEQLATAQQAILNLEKVLVEARKVHLAQEYRAMSEPILLEIQQREQEIISYLSITTTELSVG